MKKINIIIGLLLMIVGNVYAQNPPQDALIALRGREISHFSLQDPAHLTRFGDSSAVFLNSAEYINGMYYYATSSGNFGTIDPATGAITVIASGNNSGGLAYNPDDGKLYGIKLGSSSALYTIEPSTGTETLIISLNTSHYILGMTITNDGRFLLIDCEIDGISELYPLTGSISTVLAAGFTVNKGQDMAMDRTTNMPYWAAYNDDTDSSYLYSIDLDSARLTLIGAFPAQVACFATPTYYLNFYSANGFKIQAGGTLQFEGNMTPALVNPWTSSNPSVATINSDGLLTAHDYGTTRITYTTDSGDTVTKTVIVFFGANMNINIPIIESDKGFSMPAGSTAQFTSNNPPSANNPWSSSNTEVATITADGLLTAVNYGTTTITFTDSIGCSVSKEVIVYFDLTFFLNIPIIESDKGFSIPAGSTAQFTSNNPPSTNNPWSSSNTEVATITADGLLTAVNYGTTTITFNDSIGCSVSKEVTVCFGIDIAFSIPYREYDAIACGEYEWNSLIYTESGDYTQIIEYEAGCDSTITVHLTVNPTYYYEENDAVCDNQVYVWNNHNVSMTQLTAGTHFVYDSLTTINGCDSVYKLTLTVNPTYYFEENDAVCDNQVYVWDNHNVTFTQQPVGTYTYWDSLTTINGCDSVYKLILTVNPTYYYEENDAVCDNQVYVWDNHNVTFMQLSVGTYTYWDSLTTVNGCDSVYKLTLTVNPTYYFEENDTICDNQVYDWNNHEVSFTQLAAGIYTYWDSLTTVNSCDSVYKLTLTVNPTYNVTDAATICDNELPYTWNGITFTEAGTQSVTLQSVNHCDSVVVMTLTVNPTYNVTDAAAICDNELPYTWNGVTFTEAGIQSVTLQTVHHCDSVVVMTLTVNPTYNVTDAATICDSELPYTWNGVTFTEAGTQSVTLQTVHHCDSVVVMTLTVNPTYNVNDAATICDSELPYTWNGVTFTEAGTQSVTLQTVHHCDSVVVMTLTVNPTYNVSDAATICDNELPYTWNGVTFTEASTQSVTLQSVNHCDSVVVMTLTVNPTYNVTDAATICDNELPYLWNGVTFTEAGTQSVTLQTVHHCDSVVVMTLTVNPTYNVSDAATICDSELPYTWNGITFTEAGTQSVTLQSVNHCDSVVEMTLTVNPIYYYEETDEVCDNQVYVWNNHEVAFTQLPAGTYIYWDSLNTVNSCDSVYKLTLTVHSTYNVTDAATICDSELPYTWNGITFTEAGTQSVTLQTVHHCDSVVVMTLKVNPTYNVTDAATICDNELPYTWNGITFTEAGTQSVTLQTVNRCDSVVVMTLTVNPTYYYEETDEVCDNQVYVWNNHEVAFTQLPAGTYIYWDSLTTVNGCDSVYKLTLTVHPTYNLTDAATICDNELPYLWNGVTFSEAGTQSVTLQTVHHCDSVVVMTLTVNPTYNVTYAATICDNELPYLWNGVTFTEAGVQSVTLQSVNHCDSVVVMTLTVHPTYNVTDAATICDSELPYTWNGVTFTEAGTQSVTLQTVHHCDSVVVMTLTVNPTYYSEEYDAVCDNQVYVWNNHEVPFTQLSAGTYTYWDSLTTVNGCDSVYKLTLTVNPTYNVTDAATICDSELPYTWNGITFTESGTQSVTLQSVNHCDSVVTMTLTVNPTYNVTDAATICDNELPYTWNGVTFTEAGTQSVTLQTVYHCDSVVAMTLTVNPTYNVTDAATICDNELPYTWNGVTFTEAGIQSVILQSVNHCDSVVVMTLTVNPTFNVSDAATICDSELPYLWNGVTFTEAVTQSVTLQTVNHCDSVVAMTLTVNPTYNVTDAATICDNELPYSWNGVTFTEAGTQSVTLQSVNRCDSVVVMTLAVNPTYNVTDAATICDNELPYLWNGVTFTEAGTQSVTLQSVNHCDSVVAMTLTVNPTYNVTDAATICDNELPYLWNGVTFTEAGTQSVTLQSVNHCDSVVVMTLTVNPTYNVTDATTICDSELPYSWNGVTFTEAGTQSVTLQSVNHCDSVVVMTLTVNPTYNVTDAATICDNELPYLWNGITFTEAGTQSVTLQSVNHCDSVVVMTLTVNPTYNVTDAATICDNELLYLWNGITFTEAGTQSVTLQSVNHCDSVVVMTLTVNPTYNVTDAATICDNELPYLWNGVTFTEAGTQSVTLQTVHHCDSVVAMTLTVNPTYNVTDTATICDNELPYSWNGVTFTEAGTQSVTLQTVHHCDSVVAMTLTVNPTYNVTDTATICDNELPYTWNGVTFTEAGTQSVTLQTVHHCDSVVVMTLTVNPTYNVTDAATICDNELPYTWNGVTFTEAGTQSVTLQTVHHCDSVVVMTLTVNPTYNVTDAATICDNELPYLWNGVTFTEAGTQSVTLQSVNQCDSVVVMTLTVNPTYYFEESDEICDNQVYAWNNHDVPFTQLPAGTYIYWDSLSTVNGCDSIYQLTLTVNPTYSEIINAEVCQGEAYTENGFAISESSTQTVGIITDTLHLTSLSGCDSVIMLNLTVNALPTVIITGNTEIGIGESTTLTAEGADTYLWNNGENTPSIEVSPTTPTLYIVEGTDSNSCVGSDSVTVNVVTVIANFETTNFSIYPNPANQSVTIRGEKIKQVELHNSVGQLIYSQRIGNKNETIVPVSHYAEGIYFVKITTTENQIFTAKILIQR